MKYFGPNLPWLLAILLLAPTMAVAKSSPGISPGLQAANQQASQQIEVIKEKGKPVQWRAYNAANRLKLEFDGNGVVAHSQEGEWRLRMELKQLGSAEQLKPVRRPKVTVEGNRLTYDRGAIQEWYINDSRGLEQGFTLNKPLGKEDLVLQLALEGNVKPELIEKGKAMQLITPQGKTLRYTGLKAWDANGQDLSATMMLENKQLQLQVSVADAVYPITIDPILTLVEAQKLPAPVITSYGCNPDVVLYCPSPRIDIEGDTAVIARSNTVHIYTRNGGEWIEQATLASPDDDQGKLHCFGCSFSFFGNTLAVVENRRLEGYSGDRSVYVYTRTGGTWTQPIKLPLAPLDGTLIPVIHTDISDDTLVVTRSDDPDIHVYTRSGNTWAEQTQLTPEEFEFRSVRIINDIIVAASSDRVTVFARKGEGWVKQAVLPERRPYREIKEWSISDERIWVSHAAPSKELFESFSRTEDTWTRDAATLTREDLPEGVSLAGYSISVSEDIDTVVLTGVFPKGSYDTSSFGEAHILTRDGDHFSYQQKLLPSESLQYDTNKYQPYLTIAAFVNDNTIVLQLIAGSIPDKAPIIEGDIGAGHAIVAGSYLFTRTENTWTEQAKLTASEVPPTAPFIPGHIVASMSETLLLGTWAYNGSLAYSFDLSRLITKPPQEIPEDSPEAVLPDQGASDSGGGALGYLFVLLLGFMGVMVRESSATSLKKPMRQARK